MRVRAAGEVGGAPVRRQRSTEPAAQPGEDIVDSGLFKQVIGRFATGVTVVTTLVDGRSAA